MPSPASLRLRVKLIHDFEQLSERLAHGDETAMEEARDRLVGISLAADCQTMADVFRALGQVLTDQQVTIDHGGFRYDDVQ